MRPKHTRKEKAMKNWHQRGFIIDVEVVGDDAVGGEPVQVGDLVGFYHRDAKVGEICPVVFQGVVRGAPKATGTEWDQGEALAFDGTEFDVAGDDDLVVAHAAYDAASGADEGSVLIGAFCGLKQVGG